ncbi:MAG: co-chaperone GroES [Bacillota bacterium]|nr:co-chaperone GroES [Bacillota bacterium]NLL26782.1 co-chaperone GroES [Erysipelotrichia bacterium]
MIKPLNDNVLLKTTEEENIAIVLAVGDRKIVDGKNVLPMVKENDKVIFDRYAVTEVKYLNEKYLIIPETDILAVIK